MTDLTKLKELAERAQISRGGEWCNEGDCCWWTGRPDEGDFMAAANPKAILGLIERLEKAERHWANENSNNMALIAEVERLRGCVQEWERSIGAKAYIDSVMLRDEVERLRNRLEIDDRTPYDGIACRDETIKGLDEKCDRLKEENEALRSALKPFADYCAATYGRGIRLAISGSGGYTEIDRAEWQAAQAALEGGGK